MDAEGALAGLGAPGTQGLDRQAPVPGQMHAWIGADQREGVPEFPANAGGDVRASGEVVEGTAAGICQRPKQRLVVVVADAKGAGAHTKRQQLCGVNGQFGRIDDADIGLAIGEHEATAQSLVRGLAANQTAGDEPTFAEIRGAAGTDLAECRAGRGRGTGTRVGQRQDPVDAVVEDHQGDPVAGSERVDGRLGGLAGTRPLVAAHGPRAVECQGQVDRGTLADQVRGLESQVRVALAQTGGTDQPAISVQCESQPFAALGVRGLAAVSVGRGPEGAQVLLDVAPHRALIALAGAAPARDSLTSAALRARPAAKWVRRALPNSAD